MSLLKKAVYTIHYFDRLSDPRFSTKAVCRGFVIDVLGIRIGKGAVSFTQFSLKVANKAPYHTMVSGKYRDEKSVIPVEFPK